MKTRIKVVFRIEGVNDVEVYCGCALQRDDIKSQYAIGGRNPNQCGFQISGNSVSYSLNSPVSRAPVINLSFGEFSTLIISSLR